MAANTSLVPVMAGVGQTMSTQPKYTGWRTSRYNPVSTRCDGPEAVGAKCLAYAGEREDIERGRRAERHEHAGNWTAMSIADHGDARRHDSPGTGCQAATTPRSRRLATQTYKLRSSRGDTRSGDPLAHTRPRERRMVQREAAEEQHVERRWSDRRRRVCGRGAKGRRVRPRAVDQREHEHAAAGDRERSRSAVAGRVAAGHRAVL